MKSILLIEDDPFLADIYTAKFKEVGFSVEIISDGGEVFRNLDEKRPDLVVLDIVLPKTDGWEVLKKIKSSPEFKDLKVIILSNLGQKEEVEKGIKLGAAKYLIKANYTPSEVVAEIKSILP